MKRFNTLSLNHINRVVSDLQNTLNVARVKFETQNTQLEYANVLADQLKPIAQKHHDDKLNNPSTPSEPSTPTDPNAPKEEDVYMYSGHSTTLNLRHTITKPLLEEMVVDEIETFTTIQSKTKDEVYIICAMKPAITKGTSKELLKIIKFEINNETAYIDNSFGFVDVTKHYFREVYTPTIHELDWSEGDMEFPDDKRIDYKFTTLDNYTAIFTFKSCELGEPESEWADPPIEAAYLRPFIIRGEDIAKDPLNIYEKKFHLGQPYPSFPGQDVNKFVYNNITDTITIVCPPACFGSNEDSLMCMFANGIDGYVSIIDDIIPFEKPLLFTKPGMFNKLSFMDIMSGEGGEEPVINIIEPFQHELFKNLTNEIHCNVTFNLVEYICFVNENTVIANCRFYKTTWNKEKIEALSDAKTYFDSKDFIPIVILPCYLTFSDDRTTITCTPIEAFRRNRFNNYNLGFELAEKVRVMHTLEGNSIISSMVGDLIYFDKDISVQPIFIENYLKAELICLHDKHLSSASPALTDKNAPKFFYIGDNTLFIETAQYFDLNKAINYLYVDMIENKGLTDAKTTYYGTTYDKILAYNLPGQLTIEQALTDDVKLYHFKHHVTSFSNCNKRFIKITVCQLDEHHVNISSIPIDVETKCCCSTDDTKIEFRVKGEIVYNEGAPTRTFNSIDFSSYVCATDCASIDFTIDEGSGSIYAWLERLEANLQKVQKFAALCVGYSTTFPSIECVDEKTGISILTKVPLVKPTPECPDILITEAPTTGDQTTGEQTTE